MGQVDRDTAEHTAPFTGNLSGVFELFMPSTEAPGQQAAELGISASTCPAKNLLPTQQLLSGSVGPSQAPSGRSGLCRYLVLVQMRHPHPIVHLNAYDGLVRPWDKLIAIPPSTQLRSPGICLVSSSCSCRLPKHRVNKQRNWGYPRQHAQQKTCYQRSSSLAVPWGRRKRLAVAAGSALT